MESDFHWSDIFAPCVYISIWMCEHFCVCMCQFVMVSKIDNSALWFLTLYLQKYNNHVVILLEFNNSFLWSLLISSVFFSILVLPVGQNWLEQCLSACMLPQMWFYHYWLFKGINSLLYKGYFPWYPSLLTTCLFLYIFFSE